MKQILVYFCILLPPFAHAVEPDYRPYNRLLSRYVKRGTRAGIIANLVNYRALSQDSDLRRMRETWSQFKPENLATPEEKKAYYINAYNFAALDKILSMYPTRGIRARGEEVWQQPAIRLAGRSYSLDEIESRILRPMGDARIHFAIVCASLSCPDLRREAYVARKLENQLENQTQLFLANTTKGLRIEKGLIYQSPLFTWYAQDFKGIHAFQERYIRPLPEGARRIDLPYDWSLNE